MHRFMEIALRPWVDPIRDYQISREGDSWRSVALKKRDEFGQFERGQRGGEKVYTFYLNYRTGELYASLAPIESQPAKVRFKCALLLFAGYPLYLGANLVTTAALFIIHIASVALETFVHLLRDLGDHSAWAAFRNNFRIASKELRETLNQDVHNFFRSFFYFLGLEIASFEGLFLDPLKAMSAISHIEREWNHGCNYYDDVRVFNTGILANKVFFMAICFLPRGNLYYDEIQGGVGKWALT